MATNNALNNASAPITLDSGASGDSYVQFDINTTGEFRIGVDDDAGDAFKISQGSALGTNDTFIVTAAGEITKPLQPAFLAYLSSTVTNVTGDSTNYTIAFDAEIFDQNGDFASNTFTAPVTGKYYLGSNTLLGDLGATFNNAFGTIVTSNRTYFMQYNAAIVRDLSTNTANLYINILADMDAADTAIAKAQVGASTKTVDINSGGATDPQTWFCGNLEV